MLEKVRGAKPWGVDVVDVRITRADYVDAITESVYRRMEAERKRVANELRSAGQVTERVMHLCAINCLMAVIALKLVTGYWHISTGNWTAAALGSVYTLGASLVVGAAFGMVTPLLLRRAHTPGGSATVLFALAVLLLNTCALGLQLSPLLAALTFGLVARERRVHLTSAQRDFGSLGELAGVFLFVYVAALIQWPEVWTSMALALALLVVRVGATSLCNVGLAYFSGITPRKGWLTACALTPMSA